MKAIWLAALVLLTGVSGAMLPTRAASGDGPSCQSDSPPTIESIAPPSSEPWHYVTVYGCNLFSWAKDCLITIGGVRAFIEDDYCDGAIRVALPIAATSGPVVAVIDGVESEPFPYTILPLDVDPEDIIPGAINVGIGAASDINSIMAQMGDPPESVGYSFCSRTGGRCWYTIRVPEGSEVEKSIHYYTHPDVLWASPVPVGRPADGEISLPSPAPPDALPPTGTKAASRPASSDLGVIAAGLALMAVGVAFVAGRRGILR